MKYSMKSGLIFTGVLMCLLAFTVVVPMVAATSGNSLPEKTPAGVPAGPVSPHYEMPMKVNCTWGKFSWSDGVTLSPLPGTWWADEIWLGGAYPKSCDIFEPLKNTWTNVLNYQVGEEWATYK